MNISHISLASTNPNEKHIAGMEENISMVLAQDLVLMDDAVIVRMFSCFLPDGIHWDAHEWESFCTDYSKAFNAGDWGTGVYDIARDSWMHWYFIMHNGSTAEIPKSMSIEVARGALIGKVFGY